MPFGKYQTVLHVGRGGMSEIYLACDDPRAPDPKLVVLKTMRGKVDSKRLAMFNEEARIASALAHPNIIRTLGHGTSDGRPYIALEYLEGQTVDRLVASARSAQVDATEQRLSLLWILAEALAGLHHAHDVTLDGAPLHVVHRDFSPENLMVTFDGLTKVLDFGVAKAAQSGISTTTGVIKGKLHYMAPEQALEMRIDRRADVFAAGIMLWEFVLGVRFWDKLADMLVLADLIGGSYAQQVPGATPEMNAIVARALSRNAIDRYATALDMRNDLIAEIERTATVAEVRAKTMARFETLFSPHREYMKSLIATELEQLRNASPSRSRLRLPVPVPVPVPSASPEPQSEARRLAVPEPGTPPKRSRARLGAVAAVVVFLGLGTVLARCGHDGHAHDYSQKAIPAAR